MGYGPHLVDYSTSENFFVQFEPLTREPLSPFEEAVIAAKKINERLGSSLTLCLSGGLDSEAMALAFIAAQVPFDVTTLRFRNDLNVQDIGRSIEFCKIHGLKQQFIDLDVVSFFERNEFSSYLAPYFCPSAEVATQLWFAEQIKRPFVWGGEAFRLFVKEKDREPSLQAISEVEAVMFRLIKTQGLRAVPNFHFYSPELAWSFLKKSLEYKNHFHDSDRSAAFLSEKSAFYRVCGFPLLDNPNRKEKLHGFEGLKNYFDERLKSQNTSYNEQYRIPINKLYPLQGSTYLSIPASDALARKILS